MQFTTAGGGGTNNSVTGVFGATPGVGDILLAFIGLGSSVATCTANSGSWTSQYHSTTSGNGAVQLYTHIVGVSETNSYNFTFSATEWNTAVLVALPYSGGSAAFDQAGTNSTGSTPSLTDTYSGDIVFVQGMQNSGSGLSSGLAGWTVLADITPGYHENIVFYKTFAGTSVGSQTVTSATATGVASAYVPPPAPPNPGFLQPIMRTVPIMRATW